MEGEFTVEGNIVDIEREVIHKGKVVVKGNKIHSVTLGDVVSGTENGQYIMPGFIESHVHVEDSLLCPQEFAKRAVSEGTVAAVCDPHEIGNVMGIPGINYMIENSKEAPLKCFYGAPSCVPATNFETSGAILGPKEIEELMVRPDIHFLGEFMNFPGVIGRGTMEMAKIAAAKKVCKPVDGHSPGLRGPDLDKYISAGISTDHECYSYAEAKEKVGKGMKIIVRDGSAAHNMEALHKLIDENTSDVMLCTDDIHPDDLVYKGHINEVMRLALGYGCKLFNVLKAACLNPIKHYKIPVGVLKVGDPADFIVLDSLTKLKVKETYIDGRLVYQNSEIKFTCKPAPIVNNFNCHHIKEADLAVPALKDIIKVIGVIDRDLITKKLIEKAKISEKGEVVSDLDRDILKIVVVNRYVDAKPAVSFIHGFGLKMGAIAFSISHDAHNITCIGVTDSDIVRAVNLIIDVKGGASATCEGKDMILPLPIAGLMSPLPAAEVAEKYNLIQEFAKKMGSKLGSPFPSLAFMSLTVIPELKLSDLGLFDGVAFKPTSIFAD